MMPVPLSDIVCDFAVAFKAVDEAAPEGSSRTRVYQRGIGPLREAEAIKGALEYLKLQKPAVYRSAAPTSYPGTSGRCDLVIPGQWAFEFKLIRPFGDNGNEAEHWSENVLHPYEGNVSAIGDALKLRASRFPEQKGIIVFGYEHTPPRISLNVAVAAFEVIALQVVGLKLGPRCTVEFRDLIHPVHQQGKIFGWQVL